MKTYLTPIIIAAILVTVTIGFVACSAGFRGSIDNPTSSNTLQKGRQLAARV